MNYSDLLRQQVDNVHKICDESFAELCKPWELVEYKRKQLITREGEVEKYLYLVVEGIQRAYYIHGEKEPTLVFSYAPSFSGIIDSFFTQTPSAFYLETLTNSKLMRIHYNDINSLIDRYRDIESWVRKASFGVLKGTLERQVELMAYSAEEKFTSLFKRSPHVLNLIPHKYLASYIGVDPATFSKLLGTIRL